jgi:hypothetical protein
MANGTPDLVPRPDPTTLTTEQLTREIANLKALLETRLDGMDDATKLLSTTVNRVPSDVDKQVGHLKELHDEKFRSIEQMIAQRFLDNKLAVDAAFAAAKEAVAEQNKSIAVANDKSEASFTKQIDANVLLIDSVRKSSDEKIADIKDTLADRRGHASGVIDARTVIFAVITLILAILTAAALIGAHL